MHVRPQYDPVTFDQATEICTNIKARLFEPRTKADANTVAELTFMLEIPRFWIGVTTSTNTKYDFAFAPRFEKKTYA